MREEKGNGGYKYWFSILLMLFLYFFLPFGTIWGRRDDGSVYNGPG
jgi:hypothetical protein